MKIGQHTILRGPKIDDPQKGGRGHENLTPIIFCQKNYSCAKKAVPCYIGCRCQGLATKCSRIHTATFESSDSSSDS